MTITGRPLANNQDDLQATLNYALGNLGGKQKSWMANLPTAPSAPVRPPAQTQAQAQGQFSTNNQAPVPARPRGRPRKHPLQTPVTAAPQNPVSSSTTAPRQIESAPLSKSISPQLANVVTRKQAVLSGHSHITVFPSPSPSVHTPPSHEPAAPSPSDPDLTDFLNLSQLSPIPSTQEAVERMFVDHAQHAQIGHSSEQVQPTGVRAHEARPGLGPPSNSLGQINQPASMSAPDPSGQPHSTSHGNSAMLQRANRPGPVLGQFHTDRVTSTRPLLAGHPGRVPTPPQPRSQAPPPPVRTQSRGTIRPQPAGPMSGIDNPAPLSSNAAGQWYTLQYCWAAVQRFVAAYPPAPEPAFDGKRLNVLKEAIQLQDWAYLTLHQYYCLATLDLSLIPQTLREQPRLMQAMTFVQDVLGINTNLSTAYLRSFATFPAPIQSLGDWWPIMFQQQGRQFATLVTHLPDMQMLKHNCVQRHFPPLAYEMSVQYGIGSPIFQRLLFTSCLRWMCRGLSVNPFQMGFEATALRLFEQNRAAFLQYQQISQQREQQEPFDELTTFGRNLRQLLLDHENNLQRQASMSNVPYAGSAQSHLPQQGERQAHENAGVATPTLPSNVRPDGQQSAQVDMQQDRTGVRRPDRPASQPQQRALAQSLPGRPPLQSNGSAQPQPGPSPAQPQPAPRVPLLPPRGWAQPQQRVPNPARYGLHQAHLRSPTPKAQSLSSPLYFFFQGYIQQPMRLSDASRAIETITFTLSPADMEIIAHETTNEPGYTTRNITETSKTLRLRCIKWPGANMPTEQEWAIADTSWIPHSHFRFNDAALEQRRKVHYGKDLPIDLTNLVRIGTNSLDTTILSSSNDTTFTKYLIAIETLGMQSHTSIKTLCLSRRIPAPTVLAAIKAKLNTPPTDSDDDVAIVNSTLTISLRDPFSASSMCNIPVRSTACAHGACFDLDTFLATRFRAGDASRADVWRCPICNEDARPSELVVDGFIEEVGRDLEARGLGATRAIEIDKEGNWVVKKEVREGVRDESPEPGVGGGAGAGVGREIEVIDLSD